MNNKTEREEYLYHNTEKLLKKYRDILWNIEVATMQCEEDFKKEMNCTIEEFLDMSYKVLDGLKGSDIEKQMRAGALLSPVIQRIAECVGDSLCPFFKLLPVCGVFACAETFVYTIRTHSAPLIVIAAQPNFSK